MKQVFIFLIILIPSLSFSQINDEPKYFLNGKEIDWNNTFLNPKSIKSIHVNKKTQDSPNGEIYFETNDKIWKYFSLEKLISTSDFCNQIYDKSITPIFVIDRRLIVDPDHVKIDSSYFWGANVNSLSNVNGISDDCKKLVLIDIELTTEQEIRIRGSKLTNLDSLKKIEE
jgi:hypothetical protein